MNLFTATQRRLDQIAMYRLVSYTLLGLAFVSMLLGQLSIVSFSGQEQVLSLLVAVVVALVANALIGKVFKIVVNNESALITALIIFFLVLPAEWGDLKGQLVIAGVVLLAILSKYLIAYRKQHLLNPAAAGLVLFFFLNSLFGWFPYFESGWWVGQPVLFITLLIAGLLLVAKLRKWLPVLTFILVGFLVFLFEEWRFSGDVSNYANFFLSGPSLFLAFYMFTEPFTLPGERKQQLGYAVLLGFLTQTTIFMSLWPVTPELALVILNLLFFVFTLKQKLFLTLIEKKLIAKETYEFVFAKPSGVTFKSGQYLEWMLPHERFDDRGLRRYFTIASAPSSDDLRIGVRFSDPSSTYKATLERLPIGGQIIASQRAGNFLLPPGEKNKIAMVAGGIGITPFRSQLEEEKIHAKNSNDFVLYYCNNTVSDISYNEELSEATQTLSLKVVHILAKENLPGYENDYLEAEKIKKYTPDYLERFWYLSGPPSMVSAYYKLLRELKVPKAKIKRDFFPGLA